jgi:lipooligosaccharide transport system ATP-binding protein
MRPVIQTQDLCKRYGHRTVVDDLTLTIAKGSCFGLLGPNGAGKTTTIRLILGQSPISFGELRVFGLSIKQHGRTIRARCGVVPQTDNLDPDFTVAENLQIYGRYFGLTKQQLEQRIEELLDFVELSDRARSKISTLSGGMKRRLVIARALINDPELIVLDEPTTGLDPQVRHMIWGRLHELRQAGKTLLLTTHYMEEAERLCDDLVILDEGRVLDAGSPASLVQRHVEPEVIEVRNVAPDLSEFIKQPGQCRFDRLGDTQYCYTAQGRQVIVQLETHSDLVFAHRPSNLEDVFLKLTGRELRE